MLVGFLRRTLTRISFLAGVCWVGAAVGALHGCTENEPCVGGVDNASCTLDRDDDRACDACGESWRCDADRDPTRGTWEPDYVPCECVCPDGGILNTSDEGGVCYRQVGEHNDEDTGPYRETCDEPRWDR